MPRRTLLAQAIALDNLRAAWSKVEENAGVAGVDKVSVRRFKRDYEANLMRLREAVLGSTYKPKRLKRFEIPKPDGGLRVISVPCVADRVLQRAVLNELIWRFDKQFLDCSFGYRPERGLDDALDRICEHRNAGLVWVLDADIDAFFDSLDHELLMDFLRGEIDDARVLELIAVWLKAWRNDPKRAVGVPLGAALSPLLSNLYLHRLDRVLTDAGFALVRYADDFVVLCESEEQAGEAYRLTEWALEQLRLQFEPNKTRVTSFEQGFDFLGVHFENDWYSYVWKDKRVRVEGEMDVWDFPYQPGYEG